jgi:SAM-dependent methyltransferase
MKAAEFEKAFYKGHQSYDTRVGDWWIEKSQDGPHQSAYKKIARYISSFLRKAKNAKPKIMIDYACGNGAILKTLGRTFPSTSIVGIDGSRKMLRRAEQSLEESRLKSKFTEPIRYYQNADAQYLLVQTPLPNFSMPSGKADVAVFLFPNMNATDNQMQGLKNHVEDPNVRGTARLLARMRLKDPDPSDAGSTLEDLEDALLFERIVCMNIRDLLEKGGLWFKVEYSACKREDLSELEKWELLFTECAMKVSIDGKKQKQFFQFIGNQFFRSSVIRDVYDQSKDPDFKSGGYFISAFRAV